MSVIAWDGKTIAADRQSTNNGLKVSATKLVKRNGIILGWTGGIDYGLYLADWYMNGALREAWPKFQETSDWSRLVVVDKGKDSRPFFYECAPVAIPIEHRFMAFGSGRDFAMAAMYLGKSAVEAVRVASGLCDSCGMGVDSFDTSEAA